MHQLLHDRLRKSVSNGGLKIGAAPKGTTQDRFTTEFLNDSLEFANHSVVDCGAKWRFIATLISKSLMPDGYRRIDGCRAARRDKSCYKRHGREQQHRREVRRGVRRCDSIE